MRLFIIGIAVAVVAAALAFTVIPRGAESDPSTSTTEIAAGFSERYQPYSEQTLAAAGTAETVVLFFSAAWCSTCKVLRDDIAANQQSIPEGVLVLLVDYDASTEMKEKYGVVSQHTLVQVDRTGLGIARWELSRSLDDLLAEIIEI
jgi:thiol:disulfide interchange protein